MNRQGSVVFATNKKRISALMLRILGTAILLLSLPSFQSHGQSAPPPSAIVGTRLLESIVDTLEDGSRSYWMGRHPAGAIIYSASGHMSVQFMREPRPILAGTTDSKADAAELAGADPFGSLEAADRRDVLAGYYAYFGRFEVSPAGDAITHFVETSLRPNEVGVAYKRAIRIEGDQLFISLRAEVDGVPRQRVLTWRPATVPTGWSAVQPCNAANVTLGTNDLPRAARISTQAISATSTAVGSACSAWGKCGLRTMAPCRVF